MSRPGGSAHEPAESFEQGLRRSLHGIEGPAGLGAAVRSSIGGRSPREMNTARTIQSLRGVSGIAGVVLAVLLTITASLAGGRSPVNDPGSWPRPGVATDETAPPDVTYEEEALATAASESTILAALFLEGMTP